MNLTSACTALICDQQGTLEKIIRDDLGLLESTANVKRFPELVSPESRRKAERLLDTLRSEEAISSWELVVDLQGSLITTHFMGGAVKDGLIIVGSFTPDNMDKMFEEMMRISNQQANRIRTQAKEIAENTQTLQQGGNIYDELSRLNNELVTAQRKLAQKNVELKDLYSTEKQRTRELNALYRAASALQTTLDLDQLLNTILEAALRALPQAGKGLLLLREEDESNWHIQAAVGWNSIPEPESLTSALCAPMNKAAQHKEFMIIEETVRVEANAEERLSGRPGSDSALLGPLHLNDTLVGFLVLFTSHTEFFQDMDLKLWEAFGATATAAIHNAKLHQEVQQLALTDPLTGIHNRRGFSILASQQIKQSTRYETPLVVMMIDLDHFKLVNDQYGHQAGDQVLVEAARRMQAALRESDILGRYGGEEFIALLPDTDREQGKQIGKRLLQSMRDHPIETAEGQIPITISIGMSAVEKGDESLQAIIEKSDSALYRAKEKGRDQIQGL